MAYACLGCIGRCIHRRFVNNLLDLSISVEQANHAAAAATNFVSPKTGSEAAFLNASGLWLKTDSTLTIIVTTMTSGPHVQPITMCTLTQDVQNATRDDRAYI